MKILVIIFVLFAFNVFANEVRCPESPQLSSEERNRPECSSSQENITLGHRCRTTSGIPFSRVANGWRDEGNDGLVWHDDVRTHVDFDAAKSFCESRGQRLPTADEFRNAEAHGFREPLSRMDFYYYWSASEIPTQNLAYGFGTNARLIATLPRDSGSNAYYVAARCVSNP